MDPDTETTPPTPKSLTFTNGNNNKRHIIMTTTTTTTPPPLQPSSMVVCYKECLKNYAASIGGHALDGCGEFMLMPSSSSSSSSSSNNSSSDPRSLKCAACGCHRNFHRREPQEQIITTTTTKKTNNTSPFCVYTTPPSTTVPPPLPLPHRAKTQSTRSPSQSTSPSQSQSQSQSQSPISSPSPPPISHIPPPPSSSSFHHTSASAPHMLLALGNAYSTTPPSSDYHPQKNLNFSLPKVENTNTNMNMSMNSNSSGKKRYRTKFSKEQKEKMHGFSEKLGWRMNKGDDGLVQKFCNDIGVSRGVFKVWMHNNKNNFRKRSDVGIADDHHPQAEKNGNDVGEGGNADINNAYNAKRSSISNNNNEIHIDEENCVNVPVAFNGLSS